MNHLNRRRTMRWAALAALAFTIFAIWSAQAAAQTPARPPFFLYGSGTPGDVITVYDADGEELGNATVAGDSSWHTSITCAAEKVPTLTFQVNGIAATPEINRTGADQAEITLSIATDAEAGDDHEAAMSEAEEMSEDEMSEDELTEAMAEDGMSEDEMSEDGMADDGSSDDEMSEDGDESQMVEDTVYPGSGTGGLADGGAPGALTALLVALATAAVLTLGLTIRRRRGLS